MTVFITCKQCGKSINVCKCGENARKQRAALKVIENSLMTRLAVVRMQIKEIDEEVIEESI